jgi:hypothetical protein
MKIIILENKLLGGVKSMIKNLGIKSAIDFVGGWESFCVIMNINSPMDFLHLFNDLEQVQSEKKEHWTLFRDNKGNDLMVYDRKNGWVFISYRELWSFLESKFGLNNFEILKLTNKWVGDVYNLRGIKTRNGYSILS